MAHAARDAISIVVAGFLCVSSAVAAQPLQEGLVAHWTFVDGAGKDSAGACDLELVGAPALIPAPCGQAMRTRPSAYAVADSPALNINGWTGITVSVWVRPVHWSGFNYGGAPGFTPYGFVFTRGTDASNGILAIHAGAATSYSAAAFEVNVSATQYLSAAFSSFHPAVQPYPVIGNWYHLVGTYDGARVRCYVNGELDGEKVLEKPGRPIWDQPDFKTYIGTTYDLPYRNWADMCCPGAYDEVRIYNRALSTAEVGQLFRANTRQATFAARTARPPVRVVTPPVTERPPPPPPREVFSS